MAAMNKQDLATWDPGQRWETGIAMALNTLIDTCFLSGLAAV